MFKPLSFFIGFRYVRSSQREGFLSFISASSTVGIAIGVMVLIVVLSAMNGFEKALTEQLLSVIPHGEVIAVNEPIEQWQKQVEKIKNHQEVISAAPFIKTHGMIQKKGMLKGVEIYGVNVDLEPSVSAIPDYISAGNWADLHNTQGIIIGSGIANKLSLAIGDSVILLVPPATTNHSKRVTLTFPTPKKINVKVVGIFKFGGTIDDNQVFLNIALASKTLAYNTTQTQGIRIKVTDVFQASRIIREIAYNLNYYVYMLDWTRSHGHIYHDIQLVRVLMFIVLVLVIAVACFNIVSTLIMAVNEKKSDIAILKTMGAKPNMIMSSFIVQGLMNGFLGCAIGTFLGVVIAVNLTNIMYFLENVFSVKFLSTDVYFIDYLPTLVHNQDVVITVIITLLISFIATIYPAWRATKIEPARELGHQ